MTGTRRSGSLFAKAIKREQLWKIYHSWTPARHATKSAKSSAYPRHDDVPAMGN